MNIEVLNKYNKELRLILADFDAKNDTTQNPISFTIPEQSAKLTTFFSHAKIKISQLPNLREKKVFLMNLMGNKDTDTGKTLASLVIIARAVNHIYSTGKNVMLITPSSGNKAGALRDAVLKAIEVGLVKKDQLRIVTIIPHSSIEKTRSSRLFTDKELNRLNPVFVSDQGEAQDVKNIASDFFKRNKDLYDKKRNTTLWYSLGIDNYKVADAMRACIEADFFCNELSSPERYRYLHIHSVSSAYGLLGHNEGVKRFNKKKYLDIGYLLVQHLYTNDMVTSLLNHLGRDSKPQYKKSPDGIYVQEGNPNFPTSTSSLDQCIDTTFYHF